jgi:hypothetical protein
MSQQIRARAAAAVTSGIVVMSLSAAVPASAAPRDDGTPTVTVVASGLNSPKSITLGPGGLYVAESGTGGSSCVTVSGASLCEGETGAVALVNRFGTHTLLSGLPSVLDGEQGAAGPVAVTFERGRLAVLFQDTGVNADGTTAIQGPEAGTFGKLLLVRPFSHRSDPAFGADFAAFAAAHPEDPATLGGPPGDETVYDSDPYDIVPYNGGYAIADAAANDVLWMSHSGSISMLTRLPTIPMQFAGFTIDAQAVPTSLAVGPDGALYVGTLPGFPGLPGTARIYRLMPGQPPTVVASGLTAVTAIAFDHKGRLLALEFNTGGLLAPPSTPGALVRICLGTGAVTTLPVTGLSAPTGLAVGHEGAVYVTDNGNSAGAGEVLRITGLR